MKTIAIIGGGAAGFFTAITAGKADPSAEVHIFEKSKRVLAKVAVSGGGRCNVTHSCFDPNELIHFYPRGSKELRSAFHTWQPQDTVDWYAEHGVELKTEADGRMFPTTDDSQTIINCLRNTAHDAGVQLHLSTGVSNIERLDDAFALELSNGKNQQATHVILTTGGGQSNAGHALAKNLGHTITPLAPSLFTFNIKDPLLADLQGLSIPNTRVICPEAKLKQTGPVLFTHWGLSGPGILKLSAWGARKLHSIDYTFDIHVNWLGDTKKESVREQLETNKRAYAKRNLSTGNPFDFPKRFWERLLKILSISPDTQWAQLSKKQINQLVEIIADTRLHVSGKSMNKEEFVTCGGISLKQVDFKRMESRLVPNLHFAGEVLDIDGVTGGFNFQAAWTTGHLAGLAVANS